MDKTEQDFLEQISRDMRKPLLQYARLQLNGSHLAEDAVQEVFVIASTRVDTLMASENPRGWLVNTLKNVLHAASRSIARENPLSVASLGDELAQPPGQHEFSDPSDTSWVDLFYAGLIPDADFRLIKLVDLEGYSIREAAQILSIGEEACKKRVQRARARLKAALEELAD